MDENVRLLFERAFGDEPPQEVGLAQAAMAQGTRLRRRRHLLIGGGAAGVVAVLATMVSLIGSPSADGVDAPVAVPVAMTQKHPDCVPPKLTEATNVTVFLRMETTDQQRHDLEGALRSDSAVRAVAFESRQQALDKFRKLYADAPGLVQSVTANQLPESFRIKLAKPTQYPAFVERFESFPGVDEIPGGACPQPSPFGAGK